MDMLGTLDVTEPAVEGPSLRWHDILLLLLRSYADKPDDHVLSVGDWTNATIPDFRALLRFTLGDLRAWAESEQDHEALLGQWNAIVAASGSRTHGGAVGHVAAMCRRIAELEREVEALRSACGPTPSTTDQD